MSIFLICGRKRTGKDTVASYLKFKYGVQHMYLSQPMKDACRIIFNFTEEQLYGNDKEVIDDRYGISARQALQHIGTEWAQFGLMKDFPEFNKKVGRGLWVKNLLIRYDDLCFKNKRTVSIAVSDVRFPQEVQMIEKYCSDNKDKCYKIHITRDTGLPEDTHASEKEQDQIKDFDFTLGNSGTLKELYDNIDKIVEGLK
jgi:hypothetical protein